jgi:hypothetical protein
MLMCVKLCLRDPERAGVPGADNSPFFWLNSSVKLMPVLAERLRAAWYRRVRG